MQVRLNYVGWKGMKGVRRTGVCAAPPLIDDIHHMTTSLQINNFQSPESRLLAALPSSELKLPYFPVNIQYSTT